MVPGDVWGPLPPAPNILGWFDISIFVLMLVVSAVIGIYFGYLSPGSNQTDADYLLGGRSMGTIPIALSLTASFVSGITIIGYPAEIYVFGVQSVYSLLAFPFLGLFFARQFLPVFRNLQCMSVYGYFSLRFDHRVRLLASSLYAVGLMCWLPVVIYAPALAFEQVTSLSVHWVTPAVCLVCIFYTTVGGMRAVVWTDAFQSTAMLLCVVAVMVKGVVDAGGLGVVWDRNLRTGRIEPPLFDLDPTTRLTIFSTLIGSFLFYLAQAGLNQCLMQRYLAVPTTKKAVNAMWGFVAGMMIFSFTTAVGGLILFAYYSDCDPVQMKRARTKDQMMPLLVMDSMAGVPGLAGLFMAGVFSAALSSMSTGLNSMAAVFLEDWVRGYGGRTPNARQTSWILRGVVVATGVLSVAMVFVVERLGMVTQLSVTLISIANGPLFTLFIVGLFMPWCNASSALAAALAAAASNALFVVGAQVSIASGALRFPEKPVFTDGCAKRFNETVSDALLLSTAVQENVTALSDANSSVFYLFRVSYLWFLPVSLALGLLVAALTAAAGWRNDLRDVNPGLLAPLARRLLPQGYVSTRDDRDAAMDAAPRQGLLRELRELKELKVVHKAEG